MLATKGSSARIRQLSAAHLLHLARYARGRMEQEISDGQAEIEGELQVSGSPAPLLPASCHLQNG